jgi:hypothetical protein
MEESFVKVDEDSGSPVGGFYESKSGQNEAKKSK